MATKSQMSEPYETVNASEMSFLYKEGVVAGFLGAVTIALWFLILDAIKGQPFHTPTLLGTALFGRGENLATPDQIPISLEMTLMFTWVHILAFIILGGAASWLLHQAEKNPNYGFGILLLFVVFEFGFIILAMMFAETILQTLTVPAILVGNLLAAAVMGIYFWRQHPGLTIRP